VISATYLVLVDVVGSGCSHFAHDARSQEPKASFANSSTFVNHGVTKGLCFAYDEGVGTDHS